MFPIYLLTVKQRNAKYKTTLPIRALNLIRILRTNRIQIIIYFVSCVI